MRPYVPWIGVYLLAVSSVALLVARSASPSVAQDQRDPLERCRMLLGVFTVAGLSHTRDIIRATWFTNTRNLTGLCEINPVFVIGRLPPSSPVFQENATFGDIVQLNVTESMNDGKTLAWFTFAALNFGGYTYIGKTDMDTFVYVRRLAEILSELPRRRLYMGEMVDFISCGSCKHCPRGWVYMAGQFYGLSSDIVSWIGAHASSLDPKGHEDLVTGSWLRGIKPGINYFRFTETTWVNPVKNSSVFWHLMNKRG